MTIHPQIEPRILIVEDDPDQSRAIELLLSSEVEIFNHLGTSQFKIDKAASVSEAMAYLNEAEASQMPYHLCSLDLSLPQKAGEGKENPRAGYTILEHVMKTHTAKRVIVVSVFSQYKYVINAFRGGAVDFIEKPYDEDILVAQVLNCLKRLLAEESGSILDERIKSLIPHAEKGLAHRFTATFSTLINSVTRAASEIERYARERYGLDLERDAQDALMRQLRAHGESVAKAGREWARLQAQPSDNDERPQVEQIEDLLARISQDLLPCLTAKKTRLFLDLPQPGELPVLTFQQDVQIVLKEIIIGGLSEFLDYGDPHNIKVSVKRDDTQAVVRFEDDLERIPPDDAEKINEGYSIVPDPELGRKWGLSVAQHIALRGGGELIVNKELMEKPTPRGNIIAYRIPLARHE